MCIYQFIFTFLSRNVAFKGHCADEMKSIASLLHLKMEKSDYLK